MLAKINGSADVCNKPGIGVSAVTKEMAWRSAWHHCAALARMASSRGGGAQRKASNIGKITSCEKRVKASSNRRK